MSPTSFAPKPGTVAEVRAELAAWLAKHRPHGTTEAERVALVRRARGAVQR